MMSTDDKEAILKFPVEAYMIHSVQDLLAAGTTQDNCRHAASVNWALYEQFNECMN